jgi:hypothetical protein
MVERRRSGCIVWVLVIFLFPPHRWGTIVGVVRQHSFSPFPLLVPACMSTTVSSSRTTLLQAFSLTLVYLTVHTYPGLLHLYPYIRRHS